MKFKLHTLGPAGTDSCEVANKIKERYNFEIVLHLSYEDILENIECYVNDYILMPVAYRNKNNKQGWIEFHFGNYINLDLIEVFSMKTKEMGLIEVSNYTKDLALIHPATEILLKNYLNKFLNNTDTLIKYSHSKIEALQKCLKYKYRYTIASMDEIVKYSSQYKITILERYNPEMVWCVYRVKGG